MRIKETKINKAKRIDVQLYVTNFYLFVAYFYEICIILNPILRKIQIKNPLKTFSSKIIFGLAPPLSKRFFL